MFTDELYEDLLLTQKVKLTTAHAIICKEKIRKGSILLDIKRVEQGYQLFRKKHPEFPENSFRRHCYIRGSRGDQFPEKAGMLFYYLGWKIEPEFSSNQQ